MARAFAIVLAALLIAPAASLADGDPASDVLLGENVFYPYSPPVTSAIQKRLNAETQAARLAGFPLKVALIQSPVDLGVIPDLFGKPQKYADFLDQEISFQTRQPLLVVMPTGYGVQGAGAKAASALSALSPPAGRTSNDLATAALTAVAKLAAAAGHPVKTTPGPQRHTSSISSTGLLVAVLAGAAALTAIALALLTFRRRRAAA
jgi:hypothetical protein